MFKRLSIFNKAADQGNNSSDDDDNNSKDGRDGSFTSIISFPVYCIKTDRQKEFQLDLYRSLVKQVSGKKSQVYRCDAIQRVVVNVDKNQVMIERKSPSDLLATQRKYVFENIAAAHKFKLYIDSCKDQGSQMRFIFDLIDKSREGLISSSQLQRVFKELDILYTDLDLAVMLGSDGEMNFGSFFELCLNFLPLYSPRQLLQDWIRHSRVDLDEDKDANRSWLRRDDSVLATYPGEIKTGTFESVRWTLNSGLELSSQFSKRSEMHVFSGIVYITNYRLVFMDWRRFADDEKQDPVSSRYSVPRYFHEMSLPLCAISALNVVGNSLFVTSKDNRVFSVRSLLLTSAGQAHLEELLSHIHRSFAELGESVFAFKFRKMFSIEGWDFSDVRNEYQRVGLTDSRYWQVLENSDWSYTDEYPLQVIVPQAVSLSSAVEDLLLQNICRRFPATSYRHSGVGSVLARAPLAAEYVPGSTNSSTTGNSTNTLPVVSGLQGLRSVEFILVALAECPKYHDVDTESSVEIGNQISKLAVFVLEPSVSTPTKFTSSARAEIIRCEIPDIGTISRAYSGIGTALRRANDDVNADENGLLVGPSTEDGAFAGWSTALTTWQTNCSQIMRAAVCVAEKMHVESQSCLVLCKDGRDMTAPVVSLAQVLLDPYYRTFEGFASLVEKEWCSFGFRFQDRSGRGVDATPTTEQSPIFVLFLESVFQVYQQFPSQFEFSEEFLLFLADHVYSGLFGTFFQNNQKLRCSVFGANEYTVSIWSYVLSKKAQFSNSGYSRRGQSLWLTTPEPLWVITVVPRFVVWARLHFRWYPKLHRVHVHEDEWHDDWGGGFETRATRTNVVQSQYRFVASAKKADETAQADHTNEESTVYEQGAIDDEPEEASYPVDLSEDIDEVEYVDSKVDDDLLGSQDPDHFGVEYDPQGNSFTVAEAIDVDDQQPEEDGENSDEQDPVDVENEREVEYPPQFQDQVLEEQPEEERPQEEQPLDVTDRYPAEAFASDEVGPDSDDD